MNKYNIILEILGISARVNTSQEKGKAMVDHSVLCLYSSPISIYIAYTAHPGYIYYI